MRTARLLTVSVVFAGGGAASGPGGCLPLVPGPRQTPPMGTPPWADTPLPNAFLETLPLPVDRQTPVKT